LIYIVKQYLSVSVYCRSLKVGYNDSLRAMNARLGNIQYSDGCSEKAGGINKIA
jgi:hypothetical protein